MILAELGAEVIKVEQPGAGDETRGFEPFAEGPGGRVSGYFMSCNRSKRSITVNLRKPEGAAIIRGLAAQRMGMLSNAAASARETPATPLLAMVSPPVAYRNALAGGTVAAEEVDLVSRLMFMQQMHKTYAGTSTVCTGVAARLPGTLVNQVTRPHNRAAIRIGHPAGVIETESEIAADGRVLRATLGRTARRILEGTVFVPDEAMA
jgi:2-methylaconitate cis-trans-isomerase PrpF